MRLEANSRCGGSVNHELSSLNTGPLLPVHRWATYVPQQNQRSIYYCYFGVCVCVCVCVCVKALHEKSTFKETDLFHKRKKRFPQDFYDTECEVFQGTNIYMKLLQKEHV